MAAPTPGQHPIEDHEPDDFLAAVLSATLGNVTADRVGITTTTTTADDTPLELDSADFWLGILSDDEFEAVVASFERRTGQPWRDELDRKRHVLLTALTTHREIERSATARSPRFVPVACRPRASARAPRATRRTRRSRGSPRQGDDPDPHHDVAVLAGGGR